MGISALPATPVVVTAAPVSLPRPCAFLRTAPITRSCLCDGCRQPYLDKHGKPTGGFTTKSLTLDLDKREWV